MQVDSPFNISEKCILKTTKKTEYYIFENNVQNLEKNINNNLIKIYGQNADLFLNNIKNMYDFNNYKNCANVISITLYNILGLEINENTDLKDNISQIYLFVTYLNSITKTVKNVGQYLKNWIVRLYFDDSVYNIMNRINKSLDDDIIDIKKWMGSDWEYIHDSLITEIYIYECPIHDKNKINFIYKNRMLRFLPLIDTDVNICICREADGIVSKLDCHNIKIFCDNEYLLYLPLTERFLNNPPKYMHYSKWLQKYTNIKKDNFVTEYDLLAGAFGTKLKLKKEFFYDTINNVHQIINDIGDSIDGYDECLLYELFKYFTSYKKIYSDDINLIKNKLQLIEELFLFNHKKFSIIIIQNFNNLEEIKNIIYDTIDLQKYNEYIKLNKYYGNITFEEGGHILTRSNNYHRIDAILDINKLNKTGYDIRHINERIYGTHLLLINSKYNHSFDLLYEYNDKKLYGGKYMKYKIKYNNMIKNL
jgi:hypothetical protein